MDLKDTFTLIVILYLILYSLITFFKPNFLFDNENDLLRPFGVGYNNTTIMPLWLCSIMLAIFSYFIILYLLHLRYNNLFIQ
jgi:quinol-cytochrome oxidoreductase complex cytochrome b subunit